MTGLYLHIPFCVRKCHYCDFYSIAVEKEKGGASLEHDQSRFLDALELELKAIPQPFAPNTIFIGGGTPTELSDRDFARLMAMIHALVNLSAVSEWTCESNPGTLTGTKAQLMKDHGINRVSLGVQSFHPETLNFLGRIHSAEEAKDGYRLLREHGFANINLDIIYGVPGAPADQHRVDAETIAELAPEHTSFYCLMFEDGTPMTKLKNLGRIQAVDDSTQRDQHDAMREILVDHGFEQYELSNFAKPGFACRHNELYWLSEPYRGIGPGAHAYWDGVRYGNVRNLKRYTEGWLKGESVRDFEERLDDESRARERLVMGLRRLAGVRRDEFQQATGFDLDALCETAIKKFVSLGLMTSDDEVIHLTADGLFVSDSIFSELI